MWKRVAVFSVALVGVVILALVYDSHEDQRYRISIKGDTQVLVQPYPSGTVSDNRVVAVLLAGDAVRVLRVRYGRDYLAFKIELADGTEGYVISGDNFSYSR